MAAGAAANRMGDPVTRNLPAPPPGYARDPSTAALIPIVGSAPDLLSQRTRQQGLEEEARQRTIAADTRRMDQEDKDRAARDNLRGILIDMLKNPEQVTTTSSTGSVFGPTGAVNFDPTQYMGSIGTSQAPALPPEIGRIALPDTSAAQANIFARAKDKVGLQTQGSLASLRSALAARGMLGGGAEARGTSNVLTAGQGQLGDTTREQAIQEAQRLTDFAKIGYQGAIDQRAQDITARGQDIQSQESARDAALDAAKSSYTGQIAQRGQNINAAEEDANRVSQSKTTRNASVTALLGKLY